ncbi:unnamed protein product [Oreochromis niloticus]|nr:unnamed protein product [Mustela putorius furo]
MDQCEDREEGVPPSKTTLCGEHESQTKAQRNQPGAEPGHKPETEVGPEPASGSDSGSSCVSLKSDQCKDEPIDFKVRGASAAESNPLNILEEKNLKSKLSDPWSLLSGSLTALRMFLRPDLPQTENRNVALKRAQSLDTGHSFHRGPGAAAAERHPWPFQAPHSQRYLSAQSFSDPWSLPSGSLTALRMSFPYIPASKYFPRLSNPLNILEEKNLKSKLRMFLRPDLPQTENRNVALKRAQSLDTGHSFHRGPGAAAAESSVALKRAQSMDTGLSFHKGPGAAAAERVEPAGVRWLTPGLRKYSCQLTINTNTVHTNLKLSDNNRKVTHVKEVQSYPDHPDRFDFDPQLLCRNGLTGRCYWEVEWRGHVFISVSYRRIRRKGGSLECLFGNNDQSWSLSCTDDGPHFVCHNKRETSISSSSSVSNRVAVYVDCPAGTLSFYRVSSDTLIHLHTFNTTFTETLYPGFRVGYGSSVCLC